MKKSIFLMLCCFFLLALPVGVMGGQTTEKQNKSTGVTKAAVATDDATILATLKAKFAKAPSMKDATVEIAVKDGVVTLTGKAPTGRQKGTATRMAKAVAGVKSVENKLVVTNPGPVIPPKTK